MHSSLSLNSNRDKTYNKKPDFHKDVIIPCIYSNQNYQFIKHNNYLTKSDRKVILAKQARVQSIVQTIVCKKNIEVSQKKPHYRHRLAKPIYNRKRRSLPANVMYTPQTLTMDIDERLNEKALMYSQQNFAIKQKMKELTNKIQEAGLDKEIDVEQINFYLTQLSPKKKRINRPAQNIYISTSHISKTPMKGYIQQNQQRQLKRQQRNKKQLNTQPQMIVKHRPKTAESTRYKNSNHKNMMSSNQFMLNPSQVLFRSNSLMNTKLSRLQQGKQIKQNIKKLNKNQVQKQKIKEIVDKIEANSLQNAVNRNNIIKNLNNLGMVWKSQQQFLENKPNRTIMQISNQTLSLLISKRKKISQINQFDARHIKQQNQNNQINQ